MSEYTRQVIIDTHDIPAERVGVLAHPPSSEYLASLAKAESNHPVRSGDRVLYVGRADDPRKGFDLLLEAWRLVRQRRPSATLTIIGPHTERWRSRFGDLTEEAVRFAGRVTTDELAYAYASHDVLAVPSRQEGFGIAVAEALHAGLPVVSTTCGGPEQMIRESGGGTLVQHDSGALGSAVSTLLEASDTRASMGAKGRHYAQRVLGLDGFAARVAEITEALASEYTARRGA
jgi:glycosyltransferase involved in cell wall biosynthesis